MILKRTIMFCMLIAVVSLFSCDTANTKSKKSSANQIAAIVYNFEAGDQIKIPLKRYAVGATYIDNWEGILYEEYEDWKAHYVTTQGAGGDEYMGDIIPYARVQRDRATDYDTVSEGIAYGMLLAVYFNDPGTFVKLWLYALSHKNDVGFMHWIVNKNNQNITELGYWNENDQWIVGPEGMLDPVTNSLTFEQLCAYWVGDELENPRPDQPFLYEIDDLGFPEDERGRLMLTHNRSGTSASDADIDMAAALIMGYKRWGRLTFGPFGTVNIDHSARDFLQKIRTVLYQRDEDSNDNMRYIIRAGSGDWGTTSNPGTWGNIRGWNPSYLIPSWLPMFSRFETLSLTDPAEIAAIEQQWNDITRDSIHSLYYLDSHGGGKGLFPDWCNTYTLTRPEQLTTESDRGPMSFNCYYDAARVPWRLAMAYSYYGNDDPGSNNIFNLPQMSLNNLRRFIEAQDLPDKEPGIDSIVDGYTRDGNDWTMQYADYNNIKPHNPIGDDDDPGLKNHRGDWVSIGGLDSSSATFVAMFSTVFTATATSEADFNNQADYIKKVYDTKDSYEENYNYYGNALRMLSMLYMSGHMTDLSDTQWYPAVRGSYTEPKPGQQNKTYLIKNIKTRRYLRANIPPTQQATVSLQETRFSLNSPAYRWKIEYDTAHGGCVVYNEQSGVKRYLTYSGGQPALIEARMNRAGQIFTFEDSDQNYSYHISPVSNSSILLQSSFAREDDGYSFTSYVLFDSSNASEQRFNQWYIIEINAVD